MTARTATRRVFHSATFAALAITLMAGTAKAGVQAQPSTADRVIREQPNFDIIMPQRPVRPGHITRVSGVDVDVTITDTLATTHMAITVENHGSSVQQARLLLPVPAGSTVRTFGIDGIGDEPTAELLPRDEATRRYNEIVRSMTDPGLLEFVGHALIQSSVFPVNPGESRTMTIVYEQPLDAHAGRVEYVLPRSSALSGSDIAWEIHIDIRSTGDIGPVFSPSHPIVSKPLGDGSMRVGVPVMNEPGPFRMYAVLDDDSDATCLLYPDARADGSGWFMFVADAPDLPADTEPTLREVTIVIDRSGSMGGEKIKQARESAKQIVRGMRMGEFVHIIDYADDVRSFSDSPVELTGESVEQIVAYIDNIQARGGTNLHGALLESLRVPAAEETLPMVLFLTDGLATVGVRDEATIRKDAQEHNDAGKRVFTFGVGFDVNAPLLDGLAHDTRADSTFVLPNEDVEVKVGQVFDKLDGPVMINPVFSMHAVDRSQGGPELTLVEPGQLGDLFSGSRVVVLGRYDDMPDGGMIFGVGPNVLYCGTGMTPEQIKGMNRPQLKAIVSADDASPANAFVARLWAQKRINTLISEIRLAGADGEEPNQELVDEIVRLSLEHGVMTEYTAFLADETMALEVAAAPAARDQARREISTGNRARTGRSSVTQSLNLQNQDAKEAQDAVDAGGGQSPFQGGSVQSEGVVTSNQYYDAQMKQIRISSVQRGPGGTLYRKNARWVDARLGQEADAEPDQTVEFDTESYWELVEDMTAQGRQWVLSNRGDVYFMNHGRRVLVRNPQ